MNVNYDANSYWIKATFSDFSCCHQTGKTTEKSKLDLRLKGSASDIVLFSHYPLVTMEQMEELHWDTLRRRWKEPHWWRKATRWSRRLMEIKAEQGFTSWNASWSYVEVCSPIKMCFLFRSIKTTFFPTGFSEYNDLSLSQHWEQSHSDFSQSLCFWHGGAILVTLSLLHSCLCAFLSSL